MNIHMNHMNTRMTGLRVAGTIFALMALGQLLRLTFFPDIYVGGHALPTWLSAIALIVLASLSAWMWILTRPRMH